MPEVTAFEHDNGAFWTFITLEGWMLVVMSGNGEFGTSSSGVH